MRKTTAASAAKAPARAVRGAADALPDEEDEELEYDGVIYDATCPVCGEEISFDEETLEKGSILCPNCGETLEFDLGEETSGEEKPEDEDEEELKF